MFDREGNQEFRDKFSEKGCNKLSYSTLVQGNDFLKVYNKIFLWGFFKRIGLFN